MRQHSTIFVYINPASSKISWILKDKDAITKDYAHFTCPLILAVTDAVSKIVSIKRQHKRPTG